MRNKKYQKTHIWVTYVEEQYITYIL